jgi:hypothetical protein
MGNMRAAALYLIAALAVSGCGQIASSDEPAQAVTGSGDTLPASLIIASVSGIEGPPCGPTSVADGDVCLVLASPWINQSAIAYATVDSGADSAAGATVNPVLTDEGIKAFNEMAKRCFEMTDDCATGQVAIIDGDGLISAPRIMAPEFTKDQLTITGNLTVDRAAAIAAAINE